LQVRDEIGKSKLSAFYGKPPKANVVVNVRAFAGTAQHGESFQIEKTDLHTTCVDMVHDDVRIAFSAFAKLRYCLIAHSGAIALIALGFVWLALMPAFAVLVVVMIARRAGEYALVRPGREMLFTFVSPAEKYKAKNFIDTVVYRGADALSAWLKTAIELIAQQPGLAALIGALIALLWAASGVAVAKIQRKNLAER
jgi:hypothetical protein